MPGLVHRSMPPIPSLDSLEIERLRCHRVRRLVVAVALEIPIPTYVCSMPLSKIEGSIHHSFGAFLHLPTEAGQTQKRSIGELLETRGIPLLVEQHHLISNDRLARSEPLPVAQSD